MTNNIFPLFPLASFLSPHDVTNERRQSLFQVPNPPSLCTSPPRLVRTAKRRNGRLENFFSSTLGPPSLRLRLKTDPPRFYGPLFPNEWSRSLLVLTSRALKGIRSYSPKTPLFREQSCICWSYVGESETVSHEECLKNEHLTYPSIWIHLSLKCWVT